MKKYFLLFLIFSFSFFSFVFAQEEKDPVLIEKPKEESVLKSPLMSLVEAINNLAKALLPSKPEEVEDGDIVTAKFSTTSLNNVNPSCLDNRGEWPMSYTFNENADWSLENFPVAPETPYGVNEEDFQQRYRTSQFVDINGDGLLDYVYHFSQVELVSSKYVNIGMGCVLLNNGHGWDIAYRCRTHYTTNASGLVAEYWGDCADTSQ